MPDISVRAVSINTSNSANTLSVSAPSGTATGDVVIVLATRNAPSGTDLIIDNNGGTSFTRDRTDHESTNGHALCIFSRRIQGGDPSSYSFTFSGDTGATRFSLVAIAFADPHPSQIYDVPPGAGTVVVDGTDSGDITSADISITIANSIHVISAIREGGTGGFNDTTPSGYTMRVDGDALNSSNTVFSNTVSAGSTGAKTLTGAGSGSGLTQSFAISNNVASGSAAPLVGGLLFVGKLGKS